ncbi:MAG: AmmeMemoRadiSam system protein A [Peptoniphilus sp.]|nr:AmmeMemoRadiSam system protein A [Peptoniphilus sp.]MDD7363420.1 AmmeMemoRadiSam system protein A [Bacillota bacterium]MDY6044422.1 AmmeMemoRadiSam system protein A [Peptoniphilus sp.]
MAIIGGAMVPHPPLLIPEVGGGEEAIIEKTTKAYDEAGRRAMALRPETVVVLSPHSVMYRDYFHISPGASVAGDFSAFRAGSVGISCEYDEEFVRHLAEKAQESDFPAGTRGERDPRLDHGTMIPLYFLNRHVEVPFKVVRIGLSGLGLADHYRFGTMIRDVAEALDRRVFVVASGDLSHKVRAEGPYGLSEEGPVYDEKIMEVMGSANFGELMAFPEVFLERAAECGHRSFTIMAGAFDGRDVETKRLSYEGVTGVGYGVCTYLVSERNDDRRFLARYEARERAEREVRRAREDDYVALARKSVETYVTTKEACDVPKDLPEEMLNRRAGVFVSLHKDGRLRGCIGTIFPTTGAIANEIIENGISAATRDPRFQPVEERELDALEYSVDVLGEIEAVESIADLDASRYGVIVTRGLKRGLLLPNLDGVDTPEAQIAIAKQKAGIRPNATVKLERFEVVRHE